MHEDWWRIGAGGIGRQRLRAWAALAVLLAFGFIVSDVFSRIVSAQTPPGEAETPAAEAPSAPEPAPSPAPRPAPSNSGGQAGGGKSALQMVMAAGIWWLLLFLAVSLVAVFLIIEHSITIRKSVLLPEPVLIELEQLIHQGQIPQAIEYCHLPENDSLASEVVLAGLERYQGSEFGFAEYKTAVEEAGEDYLGRLYRKTEWLGVIGGVAPMLGLLGTVAGMISTFNTIAASGGRPKPDELAGGIGVALLTTLFGLLIAIPSMIAFSIFRTKIDSIVSEAGKRIERLMMPLGRKR